MGSKGCVAMCRIGFAALIGIEALKGSALF